MTVWELPESHSSAHVGETDSPCVSSGRWIADSINQEHTHVHFKIVTIMCTMKLAYVLDSCCTFVGFQLQVSWQIVLAFFISCLCKMCGVFLRRIFNIPAEHNILYCLEYGKSLVVE